MKLAEALNTRADLQKRIQQLRTRLINNSKVQEGEKPAEDPNALINELDSCCDELKELITRINLTNAATVHGGRSITDLIAQRDTLATKLGIYRDLLNSASAVVNRMVHTEIKVLPSVDVGSLQKKIDELSKF
ncbi:MAG: DIP1984 family protein, partial [Ruminococcus sp.]|nr:DIP1984 family protein [Ruminococcus sp.]